jgi:predicted porin
LEKFAMKKTLIALATLAAATGSFAQSTVTLFGGADLNVRSVTSGTNKFQGMAQDGIYSSRFGVNGTEDLGGGLKANFHFEGGMNPDVGTAAGFNFTRKSTIGLAGGFGEIRLGRDYTPLFTVAGIADPFGTNGVGSSYNMANALVQVKASIGAQDAANDATTFATTNRGDIATTALSAKAAAVTPASITFADPNAVRANNSITYYTPSFSGFNASLMYSFGAENTNTMKDVGTMTSLKLAYANGPINVAFANQVTKGGKAGALATASALGLKPTAGCGTGTAVTIETGSTDTDACISAATTGTAATEDQKWTTNFLAGSYDLGVAKLSLGYKTDKLSVSTQKAAKSMIYGVTAPVGALTLKAAYVTRKADADIGNQFAVGAVYDLSKRTSAYTTYSVLKNEAGYGNTVGSTVASTGGVKSKGFEIGVKHNF